MRSRCARDRQNGRTDQAEALAILRLTNHSQDRQHLMPRKDIAKATQLLERLKFTAVHSMSADKGTVDAEPTSIIGPRFAQRVSVTRINNSSGFGMREEKNLLPADPERSFEPSHQHQRRLALPALEVCHVTWFNPELFRQSPLSYREFFALLFYQLSERITLWPMIHGLVGDILW